MKWSLQKLMGGKVKLIIAAVHLPETPETLAYLSEAQHECAPFIPPWCR